MTSARMRVPLADHLRTPQNAAPPPIHYQPSPLAAVRKDGPQRRRVTLGERPAGGNTKPPRGTQQIPTKRR
jgi:hypothetical protein